MYKYAMKDQTYLVNSHHRFTGILIFAFIFHILIFVLFDTRFHIFSSNKLLASFVEAESPKSPDSIPLQAKQIKDKQAKDKTTKNIRLVVNIASQPSVSEEYPPERNIDP